MSLNIYGENSFIGADNVFIYNENDAIMYDSLYHFMDWPFLDIDGVSYKLIHGTLVDFTKAYEWMSNWTCPTHNKPQYVMVQTDNGFRIYCNLLESIQYLRRWGFDEDIRMVRIRMTYLSFRKDYKDHYDNPEQYDYINSMIYRPAINMMDDLIKDSKFEFSYYPYYSDNRPTTTTEFIYIVDALSDEIEQELMRYSTLAQSTVGDEPSYTERVNTVYIEYLPLGKEFCQLLRSY